ncbi:hypothetical protein VNO77_34660 [Canavalia gladiata]|uniref:Transmembrane protein n=1 Tax=Canavalia gladiata TaxID=3824 RepID=A0AAN9KGW4_CANGL
MTIFNFIILALLLYIRTFSNLNPCHLTKLRSSSLIHLSSNPLSYPSISTHFDIMEKKALLKLLIVVLCLSYVVFAAAVPSTRSFMTSKVDPLVLDDQAKENLVNLSNSEEQFDMKEGVKEGRMTLDITDYPPTGPNHSHTPKSPGKP